MIVHNTSNGNVVDVSDEEVIQQIVEVQRKHQITLVSDEDMRVILGCLVMHIQAGYKQRDATVQTINTLETLYDKYRFREEKDNESGT